jgi:phenylpropionate dioxygenase-like ring-hydroxylating dioxygenase large terminal subunit
MAEATNFEIKPEWYWTSERAEQEWDHVWSRLWQIGPREEDIPETGDVFVHSLGKESLLFVRMEDGSVRGYFNVCRHRGNRLILSDDGPAFVTQFNCAFHGWTYDLNGQLINVPAKERFDPKLFSDPGCTSLQSFRVDSFAGWLWYVLDDDAPPLRAYLGPLTDRLDAYKMERAQIVDYKTIEFNCNWKTVYDAFNESYHFQSLHPEILAWGSGDAPITLLGIHSYMVNEYGRPGAGYPEQDGLNEALAALLTASGIDPESFTGKATDVRGAIQDAKRAQQGDTVFPYETLTDSQLTDAYHYAVLPSTHFNLFPEFYVVMRYRPHPSGNPEKMYFDFIMCAPLADGEATPEYEHRVVQGGAEQAGDILDWGARNHPAVNQVLDQDVSLVEHVQKGLHSQSFSNFILGSDERRITHFHRNIDELIRGRSVQELMQSNPVENDAIDHS